MTFIIPVLLIAALLIPGMAISAAVERKLFHKVLSAVQILNKTLQLDVLIPKLKFLPEEYPSLNGKYKNQLISIFILKTHKNKSLVIKIPCDTEYEFNFCLREQTALDNIGIVAGEKDIEIKDRDFDKKYFVASNKPDTIIALLNREHVKKIALEHYYIFEKGILTLENSNLEYRHYSPLSVIENQERTLKIIEFMFLIKNEMNNIHNIA